MKIGDTFRLKEGAADQHLKLVISDPAVDPSAVVIVSMSSWRPDEDQSCILEVGDHPSVRHRSLILYSRALWPMPGDADLIRLLAANLVRPGARASDVLIERLLDGAIATPNLRTECRQVLERQGLI